MTMAGPDLSIVIVSWNVSALLRACLASVERLTSPGQTAFRRTLQMPAGPWQVETIVIDNASQDDTCAMLRASFPWVRLVASRTNLGFSAGNNRGYAESDGRFVYFLNPDTELLDNGSTNGLGKLCQTLAANESVGLVGPQLRFGDGELQSSARRFPTPLTGFFESTWLGQSWSGNPWAHRMHMRDWPMDYAHDVDWVVGAAMLGRRRALEEIRLPQMEGPFDEGFFMYSEELDLCWRLKRAGWRIVYDPASRVMHHEGRSSDQVPAARHIRFHASRVRLYEKYFGAAWANRLRGYVLFEYRWQLWLERFKRLLGSKPALRRARIDAYKQVLASKLRIDFERDRR